MDMELSSLKKKFKDKLYLIGVALKPILLISIENNYMLLKMGEKHR